ncbi:hypothetical protein BGW80DRAFT_1330831, partial [Lactifluus volemus]
MLTENAGQGRKRPAKVRLWKRQQKRHTGVGDYTLGMSDTSDTYLAIQHMPFPLDYTQTLLSLLDILSAFYAKLLGPSPFPTHARPLAPPPRHESLCCVAFGSTPLGGTAGPDGPPGPLN